MPRPEKSSSVREVVGLIAVVLGLVFVGFELRSNTRAVQAATFQSLTDISNDYIMGLAADPELADIVRRGLLDLHDLDQADSTRFFLIERAFWVRMQNVFSQYERGTLTGDDWTLYSRVICDEAEADTFGGRRQLWTQQRNILTASFVAFVEGCWPELP